MDEGQRLLVLFLWLCHCLFLIWRQSSLILWFRITNLHNVLNILESKQRLRMTRLILIVILLKSRKLKWQHYIICHCSKLASFGTTLLEWKRSIGREIHNLKKIFFFSLLLLINSKMHRIFIGILWETLYIVDLFYLSKFFI